MKQLFGKAQNAHISAEQLSAHLDNQVTAVERAHITAHLRSCETCQRELASLQHTVSLLQALPRVAVPRAFTLSEARVGIRRSDTYPVWMGGALRGLAAITAIALVAVIATSVMRPSVGQKEQTIARVAPTLAAQPEAESLSAIPAAPLQPQDAQRAESGAAVDPAVTAALAPEEEKPAAPESALDVPASEPVLAAALAAATESAAEPTVAEAPQQKAVPAEQETAPSVQEAGESAAESAAANTQSSEPASPPPAAPQALVAPPAEEGPGVAAVPAPVMAAPMTAAPLVAAAAPGAVEKAAAKAPEETPAAAAMSMSRGMGGGAASVPENWTLEPAPPTASPREILGPADGLVYAVPDGVWIVDARTGRRRIEGSAGGVLPAISPDRRWVTYRVPAPENTELWAASWDGRDIRLLLADGDLPTDDLDTGYPARRLGEVSWIPGGNRLAITTFATPNAAEAAPKFDLWTLDVTTGALRYVLALTSPQNPVFAPDGQHFALFEFDAAGNPQDGLSLYNADGAGRETLLPLTEMTGTATYLARAHWLPDEDGLLVSIPAAETSPAGNTLVTNFRVAAKTEPVEIGQIEALDLAWAPDGAWLAYLSRNEADPDKINLLLTDGDGARAIPYASFQFGAFLGWSPDGQQFLYQADDLVYLGVPGGEPRLLGNRASVSDPKWQTDGRIIYLMDQGANWMLVARDLKREPVSLFSLPRDVSYATTQR